MTRHPLMIPWHPEPGNIPPTGCQYEWITAHPHLGERWDSWNVGGHVEPVKQRHIDMFKFRIPLPPEYDVTISDAATLQKAQAILDRLFRQGRLSAVDTAYVNYIGDRIGDYEDSHCAF